MPSVLWLGEAASQLDATLFFNALTSVNHGSIVESHPLRKVRQRCAAVRYDAVLRALMQSLKHYHNDNEHCPETPSQWIQDP